MSLLINGMDMLGKCQYCPCCYHDEKEPTDKATCSVWGDSIPDMTAGRIDECPLIELHMEVPKGKTISFKRLTSKDSTDD